MTSWGETASERAAPLPCDELMPDAQLVLHRAVDVAAPAELAYRWLCQLRVAPYSYDLLDNRGQRSPRELTPGLDELEVGQPMCKIFTLASFTPGSQVTLELTDPVGLRLFGHVAITYAVTPTGPDTCRLYVRLRVRGLDPLRRRALPLGDLIMMRKQLRTLAALAERDARPRPARG
ncbi:MAG: hypothetical protein ICV72_05865 [Aldersonia sp.]|nr:hypothetical protein [Aldersonia sp.]